MYYRDDVYCSEQSCMACEPVCEDICTGFYQVSDYSCFANYNYYDHSFTYNSVDCYCEYSGWGWFVIVVLPLLVFLWICVAIFVGCVLMRKSAIKHYEKKVLAPAPDNVIMYTALPTVCERFAAGLLSMLSCGFLLPFLVVRFINRFYQKFWVGGVQGEFHGDAFDYCLNVFCVNYFLSCFSCGLWACCGFAQQRQAEWIDENTSIRGAPQMRGGQWIYLFRARPSWLHRALANVVSCLSCGLLAPLFFVRHLKETLSQVHFGEKEIHFTSDTDEYVDSVWAPNLMFNIITCGCYSLCGFGEAVERAFVDNHLVPSGGSQQETTTPAGPSFQQQGNSLPTFSSMPYPSLEKSSSNETAPLMSDMPPQYGAPTPSHPYQY